MAMTEQRDDAQDRRERNRDFVAGQIAGDMEFIRFDRHDAAVAAMSHLMTCHRHHVALIGEQQVIACSPMALRCLQETGILSG